MTIDMSKYLGLFCSEATEHLEALGQDLVAVEKSPGGAAIDSMFRHAHSVKGMASSMGFEAIATLAHRVEDLVDGVRSDRSLLTREVVDLLLNATDTMLSQVKAAGDGRQLDDARSLLDQLSARVAAITGQQPGPTRVARAIVNMPAPQGEPAAVSPATAAATAAAAASPAAGVAAAASASTATPKAEGALGLPPRFVVKVRIAPSCQVPGVRGFLVHKKLSGLGNIFDLRPPLEDLKAGRVPEGMISLELETSHGEVAIGQALKNVSEVELVSLKPVAPPAPAPAPAAPAANGAAGTPGPDAPKVVGVPEGRTVRVRVELLDYFLDSVGELLLATARIREVGKVLPEP
ncbi:MAG TPA: Hpt domain-containing protein, partial [Myxococcaceae bacterium]|nr:Hpt domain-containing protein [Myxococcaceae bacterium]